MYVQCLGSGDAFGSGGKLNTSYYIRIGPTGNPTGVLLDCGASTSIAMKKCGLTVNHIDVIIISHFHGDHFGGIPFFIREAQVMKRRENPLTIIGPEGIERRANEALQCLYAGPDIGDSFPTNFLTYQTNAVLEFGPMKIKAVRAIHSEDTNPHCLRIEADARALAFSGDTEWTDELIDLSRGADLLICEASFYNAGRKNHLSVEQLQEKAHLLQASRIVLTHAGEKVLEHAATLPFEIADDGQVLLED